LSIIRRVYREPRLPRRDAPDATLEVRMERWERMKLRMQRRREAVLSLFEGDGTGMDTPAAKGTLWGLYNSVTETENFRRGYGAGGVAAEAARAGEDVLFGSRGETMQRAFDACLAVANGGDSSQFGSSFDASLN
jgi:hypothetical protein